MLERLRIEAARLARLAPPTAAPLSPGALASLAYPDRIGLRRPGAAPRWLLSGGKGASMAEDDPLAGARLIVATDLDGDAREARIRQAAPLTEAELEALHGARVRTERLCTWDTRTGRLRARIESRLDALVLSEAPWPDAPAEARARAALEGVRALGLAACGMTPAARRLQARIEFARARGAELPDSSDAALLESAGDWLLPFLEGCRSAADLAALDLAGPLAARLDWTQRQTLDRMAPAEFTTPLGRRVPVDYDGEAPAIALRLQEMFGTTAHPTAAGTPIRVTLLSPAGRPLQVTTDLPGFWAGEYAEVRKEMRGRYPRHPWPEDPTAADPTLRAKPRGS
jgi:ATP-dependent helicase HrpB